MTVRYVRHFAGDSEHLAVIALLDLPLLIVFAMPLVSDDNAIVCMNGDMIRVRCMRHVNEALTFQVEGSARLGVDDDERLAAGWGSERHVLVDVLAVVA